MSRKRVLVSVVGPGRSGTTVLGGILGEVDGVFCPGELRLLWRRGVLEQRRCGCGQLITECEIWSAVLARADKETVLASAADGRAAAKDVAAWQIDLARVRNNRRALKSSSSAEWPPMKSYSAVLAATIDEVFAATGASVIVDTSKRPQQAAVSARIAGFEHVVVQMVRDPRAVAHSWGRAKQLPTNDKQTAMGTHGPWSSLWRWTQKCMGSEYLRRQLTTDRWVYLRYEDFVADPRSAIDEILDAAGLPRESNPIQGDGSVMLTGNHTVAGNPNRFDTGVVKIRSDDEWMRVMPRARQIMLGLAVWPLMRRYNYRLMPSVSAPVRDEGAPEPRSA